MAQEPQRRVIVCTRLVRRLRHAAVCPPTGIHGGFDGMRAVLWDGPVGKIGRKIAFSEAAASPAPATERRAVLLASQIKLGLRKQKQATSTDKFGGNASAMTQCLLSNTNVMVLGLRHVNVNDACLIAL